MSLSISIHNPVSYLSTHVSAVTKLTFIIFLFFRYLYCTCIFSFLSLSLSLSLSSNSFLFYVPMWLIHEISFFLSFFLSRLFTSTFSRQLFLPPHLLTFQCPWQMYPTNSIADGLPTIYLLLGHLFLIFFSFFFFSAATSTGARYIFRNNFRLIAPHVSSHFVSQSLSDVFQRVFCFVLLFVSFFKLINTAYLYVLFSLEKIS